MKAIKLQVTVDSSRRLVIDVPDEIAEGWSRSSCSARNSQNTRRSTPH